MKRLAAAGLGCLALVVLAIGIVPYVVGIVCRVVGGALLDAGERLDS